MPPKLMNSLLYYYLSLRGMELISRLFSLKCKVVGIVGFGERSVGELVVEGVAHIDEKLVFQNINLREITNTGQSIEKFVSDKCVQSDMSSHYKWILPCAFDLDFSLYASDKQDKSDYLKNYALTVDDDSIMDEEEIVIYDDYNDDEPESDVDDDDICCNCDVGSNSCSLSSSHSTSFLTLPPSSRLSAESWSAILSSIRYFHILRRTGTCLNKSDVERLPPGRWLNDQVVNAFVVLLNVRALRAVRRYAALYKNITYRREGERDRESDIGWEGCGKEVDRRCKNGSGGEGNMRVDRMRQEVAELELKSEKTLKERRCERKKKRFYG
jgi:hypothetical protein